MTRARDRLTLTRDLFTLCHVEHGAGLYAEFEKTDVPVLHQNNLLNWGTI